MSLSVFLFAAMMLAGAQPPQPSPQATPGDTTVLDEIVVEGRRLDEFVRDFVDEIAAPARDRGLARWRGRVCVGVANMRTESAQFIVDRVSEVALDLGLTPGEPGCRPNLVIIAADDGAAMADALVSSQPGNFRIGHSATDMGTAALRAFRTEPRPVRWWVTSMPINADTGQRAVRLPGDVNERGEPQAPTISGAGQSRLIGRVRDDMLRTLVIVDMTRAEGVSLKQLADYTAMVSLAQIDPSGDASGYGSILNLFSAPDAPSGMTDWDLTYLRALYATHPPRVSAGSQVSAVINEVIDARREAAESE